MKYVIAGGVGAILATVVILAGFYAGKLFVQGVDYFETKRAIAECTKWQDMAQMPNYYQTTWQKAQCDHYDMVIDAPLYE